MKTLVRVAVVLFVLSAFSTTAIEQVRQKAGFGGPLPTCIPDLESDCSISPQS